MKAIEVGSALLYVLVGVMWWTVYKREYQEDVGKEPSLEDFVFVGLLWPILWPIAVVRTLIGKLYGKIKD